MIRVKIEIICQTLDCGQTLAAVTLLVANVHENILSKGGLEKLKRLHAIDLSSNLLVSSDIQILFRMSTLTSLALDKNNITSLEGVEQLANLTRHTSSKVCVL